MTVNILLLEGNLARSFGKIGFSRSRDCNYRSIANECRNVGKSTTSGLRAQEKVDLETVFM